MGKIGPGEMALLALLALMLFGASRVSEVGRGLGEAIRNFKRGLRDDDPPALPEGTEASARAEQPEKTAS